MVARPKSRKPFRTKTFDGGKLLVSSIDKIRDVIEPVAPHPREFRTEAIKGVSSALSNVDHIAEIVAIVEGEGHK